MHAKLMSTGLVMLLGAINGVCAAAEAEVSQAVNLPTNAPGVVCLNPLLDFGEVYSDAVVTHRYVLTNQGARVVKILAVRAGCGCTTAVAATNEVAPGQSTTVEAVINFKGRRGRQAKSIIAETDDPGNRLVRMEFTGVVIVPIEAQPEGIHFGTIGAEGRLAREVLLTAVSTNSFQVLSAKSTSPYLTVTIEPREAGRQYLIKVVCEGPRKPGSFMTAVEVETDHPQMKQLSIPVAGFVAGDIVAAPASLILVASVTNVPRTVWVNLWSPAGKSFKVVKVELPGEGMTNSVLSVRPDRSRLEVKTWGALTGLDGTSIRIETDLESMKELLIPIRVLTTR
jgi:hypothetical protein